MTASIDRSRLGRANRRKGHDAERALAKWLRDNGWPGAERAVRAGYAGTTRSIADPGDITGTPGLVWQVKDCAREQIDTWLDETDQQRQNANANYGLLVVRRRGTADVGRWWCWLNINQMMLLAGVSYTWCGGDGTIGEETVRLELHVVARWLRIRGYGGEAVAS